MREVWNFSAGPAQLPRPVLKRAQEDLLSYNNTGMSVMELSHRSEDFQEIMAETEIRLRRLLNISADYAVLFLQGGASLQFLMAPMNLKQKATAAYIHTGNWSQKAMTEAQNAGFKVDIIGSSADKNFTYIPKWETNFTPYDYVHITTNNTIEGTVFTEFPKTGEIPLVADMSSNILSEPLDVSKFGIIYAGAQKNLGIAGLTLVIIKKDLLHRVKNLPTLLDYQVHADKNSAFNTPPTFAIYMSNLVLEWLENLGGLEKMGELNKEKAQKLYAYLDQSSLYHTLVKGKDRSIMNIPFTTNDKKLNQKFISYAETQGIKNIKGHRSIGGMRASLYNAMPLEGVDALIHTLQTFEQEA
jgi:phosphoserine aminotransferase